MLRSLPHISPSQQAASHAGRVEIRVLHQRNAAALDEPIRPSGEGGHNLVDHEQLVGMTEEDYHQLTQRCTC